MPPQCNATATKSNSAPAVATQAKPVNPPQSIQPIQPAQATAPQYVATTTPVKSNPIRPYSGKSLRKKYGINI